MSESAPTLIGTRVGWAPVPRVNLLPPEILEGRRFARLQRMLALGVLATFVVIGLAFAWAQLGVSAAQSELDATADTTRALTAEAAKYSDVPKILARVDEAKGARESAMGSDVLWYRLLDDVTVSVPKNVWFTNLHVTFSAASTTSTSTASSASADPLTTAGIGQISVTGRAAGYPDVARWLETLIAVRGLDASRLQTATRDTTTSSGSAGVQFSTTVQIAKAALSHRFDRKAS